MPKRLTDLAIRNAKPKVCRYEQSDNGGSLRLVVQPSGHKSFATRVWFNGKQIKHTLGDVAVLSLADALMADIEAVKNAKNGIDPRKAKQDAKVERMVAAENTFAHIAGLYLASKARAKKPLRTLNQITSRLTRLVIPQIGSQPIATLKRLQIVTALDRIERDNGARTADLCLSDISCVCGFQALRDENYASPIVKKMRRLSAADMRRDRTLTDSEVKALWGTGNAFAQFLLLTAARRCEVSDMRWAELEGSVWTLPASRNKVGCDLVRPLPAAAMKVLPARGADDEYVFGTLPDRPLRNFDHLKACLDKASGVKNWRLHDLRRTARSLMSRAGVVSDVAEMVLGHTLQGVRGVYDRHSYHSEKAHALEALAHQIKLIINPPKGNVTQLKRKRA